MAIIIPKDKIYNYSFNILKNNYIDRVFTNITNEYNYEPITINLSYNNDWSVESSNVINISISKYSETHTMATYDEGTLYNFYSSISGNFYLRDDKYINDIEKLIETIDIQMDFDKEYPFNISQSESIQKILVSNIGSYPTEFDSFTGIGIMAFENNMNYDEASKQYNIKFRLLLLNKSSMDLLWDFKVRLAKTCTIKITPEKNEESLNYIYTNKNNDFSNFEFAGSSMFHKGNGLTNESQSDVGIPLYEVICKDIAEKYDNGRMTLEIETRYTTFKDSDGNDINNGNNYLIKVGDVVKPEMTNKFKNFQYEYIVTSAEYEYNGSDKLYLKLLQI